MQEERKGREREREREMCVYVRMYEREVKKAK